MQQYTLSLLLEYIADKFLFVFIFCLLGAFTRDCADTIKNLSSISVKKVVLSSLFDSIIVCAILDYYSISFSLLVAICFFSGLWSTKILETACDWKFVKVFIRSLFKIIKSNVGNAVSETMKELDEDKNKSEDTSKDNNETLLKKRENGYSQ